jgi:hypothetical protein
MKDKKSLHKPFFNYSFSLIELVIYLVNIFFINLSLFIFDHKKKNLSFFSKLIQIEKKIHVRFLNFSL